MPLVVLSRDHRLYPAAEGLIKHVFAREYGANVDHLPDRILAVVDDSANVLCAAGLRDESSGLFSECYLDQPVEQAIRRHAGGTVRRDQILELTALAAARPGAMAALLQGFAEFGLKGGYCWGLFTATARLRRMTRRIGIDLVELCEGRRERVANPGSWGSYYEHGPRVCAVDGRRAAARLNSRLLTACSPKAQAPAE